jgi:hypothetical protein
MIENPVRGGDSQGEMMTAIIMVDAVAMITIEGEEPLTTDTILEVKMPITTSMDADVQYPLRDNRNMTVSIEDGTTIDVGVIIEKTTAWNIAVAVLLLHHHHGALEGEVGHRRRLPIRVAVAVEAMTVKIDKRG